MRRRPFSLTRDYDAVLALHRMSWPINFPGSCFSEPSFRSALAKGQQRGGIYVYEESGEVLAWMWLDYNMMREAHLRQIQVSKVHWGRGIGRRIMHDAIAMATQHGCVAITLSVTKSNAPAMALYASLGFAMTRDDGDRQRMRLELPDPFEEADTAQ
jgi:ribosomal protein S18 acetylase RimI-like enzyme